MGLEGLLRYREVREKETTPVDVIYMFNKIQHPRDRFYPLEEYDEEDFQLRFRLFLSALYKERSAANFDAASCNAFRFYATGTFGQIIGALNLLHAQSFTMFQAIAKR